MNDFEYQGGDVWSLEEPDAEGYGKTVISFEFDKRNETIWVIDQSIGKSFLCNVAQGNRCW
jgi:hypothetical protein